VPGTRGKAPFEVLMQQWQVVQHCYSENSDKIDELSTTVQRHSFSLQEVSLVLEEERTFSAGLNAGLREFFESVSRRFDAIDQKIKEQLGVDRNARDRQFETLLEIVREKLPARMVDVFEEGLFREKTAREDSNAKLRKTIEVERAIRKKMQTELMREREAREQLSDRIERRMELINCLSSARSCTNNEAAREIMQFGTSPKFGNETGANATFAMALTDSTHMTPMDSSTEGLDAAADHQIGSPPPCTLQLLSGPIFGHGTGDTSNKETDCQFQTGGECLTANSRNRASLTGTWRFNSKHGWTRESCPPVQLSTQQKQQKSPSMIPGVMSPPCSGVMSTPCPTPTHKSPRGMSVDLFTPPGSACILHGIAPRLAVPSMLEVTRLQVEQPPAQVQQQQPQQQQQGPQLRPQTQQQQKSQQNPSSLPSLSCTMPLNSLDLPEKEYTFGDVLARKARRSSALIPGSRSKGPKWL